MKGCLLDLLETIIKLITWFPAARDLIETQCVYLPNFLETVQLKEFGTIGERAQQIMELLCGEAVESHFVA